MNTRSNQADDDFQFLAKAAEIISNLKEIERRAALSEKRAALAAAEREACDWEERRQLQIAKCADAAACTDLRCRRSKRCRALRWISSKAEAARLRLAAERAKWPAPDPEAAPPPGADKKKGRTGVRP